MSPAQSLSSEHQRLRALRSYDILDTPGEPSFDAITDVIAELCDVPIALVSMVDENRQWFKSNCGLTEIDSTGREVALCSYAIMHNGILEIPDTTLDPRFAGNSLVTGEPFIRFYAGSPLIDPDGMALGTLCVIDRKPRTLTDVQRTHLERLTIVVTGLITARSPRRESITSAP